MKHKSFAPWLVALVCFGPFAAALFIYYGPFGLDVAAAAAGQPRAAARAGAVAAAAGAARADASRGPSVAADLCKNDPVRAAMRAAPGPAPAGAAGARPRPRSRPASRVARRQPSAARRSRSSPRIALDDAAGRGVVEALGAERIGDGRVYVADPRGDVDLELSAGRRTKRAIARPRTVAGRIRLMNAWFVRLARVGAVLALRRRHARRVGAADRRRARLSRLAGLLWPARRAAMPRRRRTSSAASTRGRSRPARRGAR